MDCDHTVGDRAEVSGRDFRRARVAEGDKLIGDLEIAEEQHSIIAWLEGKLLKSIRKHKRASLMIGELQLELASKKKELDALKAVWSVLWERFIENPAFDDFDGFDFEELGEKAGLLCRAPYDPEKHGEEVEAEPGEFIYVCSALGAACMVKEISHA